MIFSEKWAYALSYVGLPITILPCGVKIFHCPSSQLKFLHGLLMFYFNLVSGSLYIDTLVDQLRKYGTRESVENVLRRVQYNVNTVSLNTKSRIMMPLWKQAPYFECSLQKEFIFLNNENGDNI